MAKRKAKQKAVAMNGDLQVYKPNYPIIKPDQFARVYIMDNYVLALIFEKINHFTPPKEIVAKDASLLEETNVAKWNPLEIMGWVPRAMIPVNVTTTVFTAEQIEYGHGGFYYLMGVVRYNHTQTEDVGLAERKGPQKWMIPFNTDARFRKPYNVYPATKQYKDKKTSIHAMREHINSVAFVFVPYEDSPMSECVFLISNKCWVNKPAIDCETGMPGVFTRPGLQLIGADDVKEGGDWFYVEMTPGHPRGKPVEIYLENTAGYISKQRVNVGERFKFIPLGLEPGDTARVKAGWVNYPGVTEKTIKVI